MSELGDDSNVYDGPVVAEPPSEAARPTGTIFVACREVNKPLSTQNNVRNQTVDANAGSEVQEGVSGCACHSPLTDEDLEKNETQNNEECHDGADLVDSVADKPSVVETPDPSPSGMDLPVDINEITYVAYQDETVLPEVTRLMSSDLSEPYSVYTYRYFIHGWPKLTFLAKDGENFVGAVVCKAENKVDVRRGYIAMLAVQDEYRRRGIGTELVRIAVRSMVTDGCGEVVLETEVSNRSALRLYENLGFMRDKRLFRYYLNGVDALRLKLLLK